MTISNVTSGDFQAGIWSTLDAKINAINTGGLLDNTTKLAQANATLGSYSVTTQNTAGQPLTGLSDGLAFTYTYNTNGTVATLTINSVLHTYTYTNGVLTGVV